MDSALTEMPVLDLERWEAFLDQRAAEPESSQGPQGFDRDYWDQLAATGFFSCFADSAKSHAEALGEAVRHLRALGRVSPDRGLTFSAVTQLASTILCLRLFGGPELQAKYLARAESGKALGAHAITEENAGSDVLNMESVAVRHSDHYLINGAKKFITNGPIAETVVVYAKTTADNQELGLTAFMVETAWPGMSVSPPMPTAGLNGSPLAEIRLHDVRVPAANRIGHDGAGLLVLDQVMKREMLLAFAANLGEMERQVSEEVAFINSRKQFGRSIGSNQLVANRVVDTQIAIELGGALLESIANRIDGYDDITIPTAAAKIFISETNVQAAINAIQVRGGQGFLKTNPYIARLIDAVPGMIYSGSNDVLRGKIATMLGVTP